MTTAAAARLRVLGAALLFSTGGAAIKATSLSSWQVASFRSGIAALTLLLFVPAARQRWTIRTTLVGVAYAVTMISFVTANKLTTAANTIFLQSTAPFYIVLFAPWLLHEPVRTRDLGFMAAIGSGLALFFVGRTPTQASAPDPFLGNLIALLSGVAWGATVTGLRWLGKSREAGPGPALAATITGNVLAFAICLPAALPASGAAPIDWAVVTYLGAFQIGAAYIFLTAALRQVPALEASLLLLIEPALNPLWAWLVQGESPGAWPLLGGGVIMASTAVKAWSDARHLWRSDAGQSLRVDA